MTPVLVFLPTEKPTAFAAALQLARAKLAGEAEGHDATLTDEQSRQFGSAAKVRAPFQLAEAVTTWRDECLLRHNAEVGVVFYTRNRANDASNPGVWMCGWVEGNELEEDGAGQEEKAAT